MLSDAARAARREYERNWRKQNHTRVLLYHSNWQKRHRERQKVYRERYWEKKALQMAQAGQIGMEAQR